MQLFRLFSLAALIVPAFVSVPGAYAQQIQIPPAPISPAVSEKIIELEDVSNGKVTVRNTGTLPITAWAVQIVEPDNAWYYSDVASVDLIQASPLLPKQENSSSMLLPEITYQQVRVVAVIFADGTHVGHAINRGLQEDVLAQLFEQRRARADAWTEWAKFIASLPADNSEAINAFLKKVDSGAPVDLTHGQGITTLAQSAAQPVLLGIQTDAAKIREWMKSGTHDETWIRRNVLNRYGEIATAQQRVAIDNGEATLR